MPNHEQWNEAIFDWFFGAHVAGRPVYLSVDESALRAIATKHEWDEQDPLATLSVSLRPFLSHDAPFSYWDGIAGRWEQRGAPTPPPFIHLLALTVIPTTLRRDTSSLGGYYPPLFETLGIGDNLTRREDYRWHVPSLWRRLASWLTTHGGAYGLPTAKAGSHSTAYLGWSRSQAVVRSGDRSTFIDFFEQVGYTPGESVPVELLLARFERWCRRAFISDRLRSALVDLEHRTALGEILLHDLETWTGESRDDEFRSVLRVVPRLNASKRTLTAVLLCPNQFAGITVGERVVAQPGRERVFLDWPMRMQPGVRRENFEIAGVRLQFRHRDVHAFEEDPILGGYSGIDRMQSGRSAWVAVSERAVPERRCLEGLGYRGEVWPRVEGWVIFRDVLPDGRLWEGAPAALQDVLPASGLRASLRGGLALGLRRYLPGGAPDLVVPASPLPLDVFVDQRRLLVLDGQRDAVVPLRDTVTTVGAHRIEVGDQVLRVEVSDSPDGYKATERICHVLLPEPPTLLDLCDESGLLDTDLSVSGAAVRFSRDVGSIVSFGPSTEGWVLLGPGYERTELPAHPPWIAQLGQSGCHYSTDDLVSSAEHPVKWIVRVMAGRAHIATPFTGPVDEVRAQSIDYFGARQLFVPSLLADEWIAYQSAWPPSPAFKPSPQPPAPDLLDASRPHATADRLLEWCSLRGAGSIGSFVETCQWMSSRWDDKLQAYRLLRNLSRLGHVEVNWLRQRWSVTPPTIVQPFGAGGLAFVVGQRLPGTAERLDSLAVAHDLDIVLSSAKQHVEAPQVLLLRSGDRSDLESVSAAAGMGLAVDLSGTLATMLPTIDRMVRRGRPPGGFERRRIEVAEDQVLTIPEHGGSLSGSYEHDSFGPMVYSIAESALDDDPYLVDRSTAVWYSLRQRKRLPITYDAGLRAIGVRSAFGLPLLHERALVMATGLLPATQVVDGRRAFIYPNVSPPVAEDLRKALS